MGQKVHPYGIRLGIVKDWTSTWYADTKNYANYLNNDLAVRAFLRKKLAHASVSRIQIERPANNARIIIHTARPGIVIGKKGEDIESLRKQVTALMKVPALGPAVEDTKVAEQVEVRVKYSGYVERQREDIERQRRHEDARIPDGFEFAGIPGLSAELQGKLAGVKPETLGQAQRIPGMTPAALSLLLVQLRKRARSSGAR